MIDYKNYFDDDLKSLFKRAFIITKRKGSILAKVPGSEKPISIPVLPNSTVARVNNNIWVNHISPGIFCHEFEQNMRKKDKITYVVKQNTKCPNALSELTKYDNTTLLWHGDHFDGWHGIFEQSNIDRIKNEKEILVAKGLTISSVLYEISHPCGLSDFIITKPYVYKTNTYKLELLPYIEIAFKTDGQISTIVPVEEWKYHKAYFPANELLSIDENGNVSGPSARSFKINGREFEKGVPLIVEPNGTTYTYAYEIQKNGKLGDTRKFIL